MTYFPKGDSSKVEVFETNVTSLFLNLTRCFGFFLPKLIQMSRKLNQNNVDLVCQYKTHEPQAFARQLEMLRGDATDARRPVVCRGRLSTTACIAKRYCACLSTMRRARDITLVCDRLG